MSAACFSRMNIAGMMYGDYKIIKRLPVNQKTKGKSQEAYKSYKSTFQV